MGNCFSVQTYSLERQSAATASERGICNAQACAFLNERRSVTATIAGRAVEETWGLQS